MFIEEIKRENLKIQSYENYVILSRNIWVKDQCHRVTNIYTKQGKTIFQNQVCEILPITMNSFIISRQMDDKNYHALIDVDSLGNAKEEFVWQRNECIEDSIIRSEFRPDHLIIKDDFGKMFLYKLGEGIVWEVQGQMKVMPYDEENDKKLNFLRCTEWVKPYVREEDEFCRLDYIINYSGNICDPVCIMTKDGTDFKKIESKGELDELKRGLTEKKVKQKRIDQE